LAVSSAPTTSPRRMLLLSALAAGLGLVGGGAAWVLLHLIGGITNAALFHRWTWALPSFDRFHPGPGLFVAAMGGGLLVSLLARWAPQIRGHGIPEAMEAVLTNQSRIKVRTALAKPLSAAIAIGTGGPFGAEGPIIVTGGALGSLVGQVVPTSPSERKILLACGAAAGMSATFGAPLAAVVLAIELLLFEFSARAFVPLVVASSLAGGVHSALFGTGPLFHVPPHNYTGLDKLPFYAVLGLVAGLLAVVVTKGLFVVERGFRALPVSEFWHPIIGAAGFAAVGLVVPRALGVGYGAIGDVLATRLAVGTVAALGIAKLVAWWVALASGTSGGTLAPLLLISGCFGTLVGSAVNDVVPSLHVSPGAFALVAMAATFGASVKATFTAIVFVFELTRDYQIILPLMLASVVAELVASALLADSLMTEKLTRRGLHVGGDYAVDVLATTSVAEVMTTEVETLGADATVRDAVQRLTKGHHGAFPVVDSDGQCVGIVAREDLLTADPEADGPVDTVASSDLVTVSPSDTLLVALELIFAADVGHLPVLDDRRLVGMLTRTDILRARSRQLDLERPQPGLRAAMVAQRRHARLKGAPTMRHVLVVANQTLGGGQLVDAIEQRVSSGDCRFHVLVPATQAMHLYDRVLDAYGGPDPDDQRLAVAIARQRLDTELLRLQAVGAQADGTVGDPDPLRAMRNALAHQSFDEIILSTLPAGLSHWIHMDLPSHLRRITRTPVTVIETDPE
jgi:CIC family chloride channel protein